MSKNLIRHCNLTECEEHYVPYTRLMGRAKVGYCSYSENAINLVLNDKICKYKLLLKELAQSLPKFTEVPFLPEKTDSEIDDYTNSLLLNATIIASLG